MTEWQHWPMSQGTSAAGEYCADDLGSDSLLANPELHLSMGHQGLEPD